MILSAQNGAIHGTLYWFVQHKLPGVKTAVARIQLNQLWIHFMDKNSTS